MNDDVKRQALLAAQGAKDHLKVQSLPAKEASMADVERGPTTIPGQMPGYGRNYNPPEPMPPAAPAPSGPTKEPGG